jgi:hypothetical protein
MFIYMYSLFYELDDGLYFNLMFSFLFSVRGILYQTSKHQVLAFAKDDDGPGWWTRDETSKPYTFTLTGSRKWLSFVFLMYSLVACCRSSNGTINNVSVENVVEIVISIEMRNQNGVVLKTREGSYLKKVLLNGIYIFYLTVFII